MDKSLIYPVGTTRACGYAAEKLRSAGFSLADHPSPEVTHLLLDVPAFGNGRGENVPEILQMLPRQVIAAGGNLCGNLPEGCLGWDFLQDEDYLAQNAAITAQCTLRVAAPVLSGTLQDAPALVIGWGRIGKCLGKLLKALGNDVTVAARKEKDRAMLRALGYRTENISNLPAHLGRYRIVFNTAPEPILSESDLSQTENCVKIDLASKKGLGGGDVIWARGLPERYAPESSGELIARTMIRFLKEES